MQKRELLKFHARLLSLDYLPGNREKLLQSWPQQKSQWQHWVKTGSDHLVLPSAFLALRRHELLAQLPDDLVQYLQYVYELNCERNQKILQQAHEVQYVLEQAGVRHVFLKGAGNLFDNIYRDNGERILYDMDILVGDGQMLRAAEVFADTGYDPVKPFNPRALSSTMHYPLLVKEDCVAGVEIHCSPVQYMYKKILNSTMVFSAMQKSRMQSTLWVPGDREKIAHNFIHAQLMHNGHYHADVSLRDLYDLLLLSQRENPYDILCQLPYHRKKAISYLKLMYKVFDIAMPVPLQKENAGRIFLKRQYWVSGMTTKQSRVYHLVVLFFQKYVVLPLRMLWSATARNYVFSRLTKKSWYQQHAKAMWKKIRGK